MRRALLLLVLPLLLVGPSLLTRGKCFLPLHPAGFEPLLWENPALADRAGREPNYLTVDRLFPVLTDELAIREQLRTGQFPSWDPLAGLGAPLWAGTIAGAGYPPNWLRYAVDPVEAGPWCALLALWLAGLGMGLFLERRGLSSGACAVGALAMQTGGWAFANLHYAMKVDAALWLPWSLWAIDGILAGKRRAALALFASTALSFLAGFPQVALFCAAAAGAYGVWRWLETSAAPPRLARALAFLGLGLFAAAVQLLPTAEASATSLRLPQDAESLEDQSLPLATTLTLVVPELFGSPGSARFADADPATWMLALRSERGKARHANALEWNLFAGVAVLALAAGAVAAGARAAVFPALAALLAVGFAQGWPIARWLYHVPGLNLGSPARAACVAWTALPWLAALGAQALIERRRRAFSVPAIACLLAALVGIALAVVAEPSGWPNRVHSTLVARHEVPESEARALVPYEAADESAQRLNECAERLVASACAALIALLLALALGRGRRAAAAWAPLALAIALEGALAAQPHRAPRDLDSSRAYPGHFPPSEAMDALARAAGDGRILRIDTSASGIDDVVRLARPTLPRPYGIADLTPYCVFSNRWLVDLVAAIDPKARFRSAISRLSDPALLDHPVLDRLRVTAVLSHQPLEHPRLEPVLARPGFQVYRRSGCRPPAWIVPSAVTTASDETALGLLAARAVDPRAAVVLAPGTRTPSARERSGDFAEGAILVTRPAPDRLSIQVRGTSGGWLVLSEAFYPGWRATVDGEDAAVVRADHALRAVKLEPGDHAVELEYRPPSLRLGALTSAGSLLLALFFGLARERRAAGTPASKAASPGKMLRCGFE